MPSSELLQSHRFSAIKSSYMAVRSHNSLHIDVGKHCKRNWMAKRNMTLQRWRTYITGLKLKIP